MRTIYNEIEPYAVEWLGNLVREKHISEGRVDSRSIRDLRPEDVVHASQFHAFAGIGGWSYALRLAGWPDDRLVWTGSCPCQPFSSAGRRGGFSDDRHLWPEWFRLIRECRPPVVLGEQVASPDGLKWLDAVSADLEGAGYAFGAADLCAAGVGAPHIRQRLYFVAHSSIVGDPSSSRSGRNPRAISSPKTESGREGGELRGLSNESCSSGKASILGDTNDSRLERSLRESLQRRGSGSSDKCAVSNPWTDAEWLPCRDGKARPIEPSSFPLANGISNRVGRLRAYGNAIVPQVAATFIKAVMEIL